ncbi:SelT/SelW/SelH family protein [Acidianus ambivalens]|uniref:SelT/SelW/SelH family protein n=1 Tax=Acidianus ambivalens TaxID=2283 RepID=A0A650CV97_ACIAM|nr:Rdx family protein [Acidianus ambivalens]MQL55639.1 SelT/SelW/SelH family protein [Acidianus ambivalens]QGR21780.1 SelT/SelW/SelH family protein [Acidianus ambivalens]
MVIVKIVYCRPCGYLDRALELARDLLQYFENIKVEIEQGKNGIFDVYLNDELIFSRYKEKRFPENMEILKEVGKRINNGNQ